MKKKKRRKLRVKKGEAKGCGHQKSERVGWLETRERSKIEGREWAAFLVRERREKREGSQDRGGMEERNRRIRNNADKRSLLREATKAVAGLESSRSQKEGRE